MGSLAEGENPSEYIFKDKLAIFFSSRERENKKTLLSASGVAK